jgi:hypothetical protein
VCFFVFFGVFFCLNPSVLKIFFWRNPLSDISFGRPMWKNAKKKFAGLEKGRIFAPAFDRERHPRVADRGSERTLKF